MLLYFPRQPIESLVDTLRGGGAGGLYVPLPRHVVEAQRVRDAGEGGSVGKVPLVGQDEERTPSYLFVF